MLRVRPSTATAVAAVGLIACSSSSGAPAGKAASSARPACVPDGARIIKASGRIAFYRTSRSRQALRWVCGPTLEVTLDELQLGGEPYAVQPAVVGVVLDLSRMTHAGYALRLRFEAAVVGPCMRCLEGARPVFCVDAREIDQPGEAEELSSPYVTDEEVDLRTWAHDALALALPVQLLCREDCAGLCPECGADLNEAGPEHAHEREPDSRWAKLSEIRFD